MPAQATRSWGGRLAELAHSRPDEPAVIWSPAEGPETVVTRRQLDEQANAFAHVLVEAGAGPGTFVVNGLANCPEHVVVSFATWKAGACALPMKSSLPERERDEILALADPAVVVAEWSRVPAGRLMARAQVLSAPAAPPLPDVVPQPGKAIASGGSTGRPKIIVANEPLAATPERYDVGGQLTQFGGRVDQIQLMAGSLHHNAPFVCAMLGVLRGHRLVLMDRFDAARAVDLIERHRVQFVYLAPTMMQRIARLEGIAERDLSSLEAVFHTSAPCPGWLKQAWIDLVGPEAVYEAFGAAEDVGHTILRGDQWLTHPGSVGLPTETELRILDEDGSELPPGEVGGIYMRSTVLDDPYRYVGAPPAPQVDGFTSVGDLGSVDADGFVYLADRRVDLIITGGVNVYPAEVEAALSEHPGVADVAVVGLPDPEWGKRVHAVVQPAAGVTLTAAELDAHCRDRLSAVKVPKSWSFRDDLPRDEGGKLRRQGLIDWALAAASHG